MDCGNVFAKLRSVTIVSTVLLVATIGHARQIESHKDHASKSARAEGAALYKRHCAVCHGDDAKGGSAPRSAIFTERAPNLTILAQRHDGTFPADYVTNVLHSGVKMTGHGSAEMPVWGSIFKASAMG